MNMHMNMRAAKTHPHPRFPPPLMTTQLKQIQFQSISNTPHFLNHKGLNGLARLSLLGFKLKKTPPFLRVVSEISIATNKSQLRHAFLYGSSKIKLETYVHRLRSDVENEDKLGGMIAEEDKQEVVRALEDAVKWLDENQAADMDVFEQKMKEVEVVCNPVISRTYMRAYKSDDYQVEAV